MLCICLYVYSTAQNLGILKVEIDSYQSDSLSLFSSFFLSPFHFVSELQMFMPYHILNLLLLFYWPLFGLVIKVII